MEVPAVPKEGSAEGGVAGSPAPAEEVKKMDAWEKVPEVSEEVSDYEENEESRKVAQARAPTRRMMEEHELQNHSVYQPWCEVCVAGRG